MCPTSALDFELSGQGETVAGAFALKDVQQAAVDAGFVKSDVGPEKPLAQRADLAAFFKTLGVSSLSGFKRRFYAEKLPKPRPGMTPLVHEKVSPRAVFPSSSRNRTRSRRSRPSRPPTRPTKPNLPSLDRTSPRKRRSRGPCLPCPSSDPRGGVDGEEAAHAPQARRRGDEAGGLVRALGRSNKSSAAIPRREPMWAPHGGLDFDGRERWEKWERYKGMDADAARLEFVKAYGKAMSEERAKLNFRAY